MLNLNAKERILLQDEKSHEELCVEKYNKYSKTACERLRPDEVFG